MVFALLITQSPNNILRISQGSSHFDREADHQLDNLQLSETTLQLPPNDAFRNLHHDIIVTKHASRYSKMTHSRQRYL